MEEFKKQIENLVTQINSLTTDVKNLSAENETLKEEFNNLLASTTLPLEAVEAMRTRLFGDRPTSATQTAKLATSENKAVNEAGASSYSVMDKPDGFDQITFPDGTVHYYPFFN